MSKLMIIFKTIPAFRNMSHQITLRSTRGLPAVLLVPNYLPQHTIGAMDIELMGKVRIQPRHSGAWKMGAVFSTSVPH